MTKMRGTLAIAAALITLTLFAGVLGAHDLFLKPDAFFVKPNSPIAVRLLNGTFTKSEGAVHSSRLRSLDVIGNEAPRPDPTAWDTTDKMSTWHARAGKSGTYVLGASLLPRTIRLSASEFNDYLREDGLPDILADRKRQGELNKGAHERYAKHVKAIVQVGNARVGRFDTVLGYPAELVPLDNPYRLRTGQTLRVRALAGGTPLPNQLVLAGGHTATGSTIDQRGVRTDRDGVALIVLRRPGAWYVKFINMKRIDRAAGDSVDYESKWATLTFAVQ